MPVLRISLNISTEQILRYYSGAAATVVARSQDGRTVQFPASALRHFVTRLGVHGDFLLHFDADGKLIRLQAVREFERGMHV